MSKAKETVAIVQSVATVVTAPAAVTPAVVVPKAPSKKSLALAIFQAKLVERTQGLFASNKDFRAAVLTTIQKDLGVSIPSAATMYNAAKQEAEAADSSVVLGRDPKKEKVAGTGKRGRPAGSKNAAKDAEPAAADATAPAETAAAPVEATA